MFPGTSATSISPRKRQKLTTTACEPCRSRKVRCDGNKPSCEACSRRSGQCFYQATTDVKSTNTYVDSLVTRVAQLEQELGNARATILKLSTSPDVAQPPPQNHNIDPRLLPSHDTSAAEAGSVDAMGGGAGVADTFDANHTFYGSSSALGFTRQVYGTILEKDTASPEPELVAVSSSVQQYPTLPTSATAYAAPESFSLLPRELADHLMCLYWDRVHVLYPFLHKTSFGQAYEDLWKPATEHRPRYRPGLGLGASKDSGPSSVIFHCAFNAALALGMQFSDLPLSERERLSSACLAKSKNLLQLDLFDDGNISLVQTLLLLTQYFQSTQWPSKCWTSIGLACRLAQGLGLHVEEDRFEQKFSVADREIRRRVWHGCVTLDIIVSMTLGRPAMLVGSNARSLPAPIEGDDEYQVPGTPEATASLIDFFTDAVKLYRIVGRILLCVYKINDEHHEGAEPFEGDKDTDALLKFEEELARFTRELPRGLQWQSSSKESPHETTGILARQSHVLHVRVLHACILLFRPAFLQFCRSKKDTEFRTVASKTTEVLPFDLQCALNCVRAALELLTSVKEYSATEATGAWWYNVFYTRTAAMVVLLSGVCAPICNVFGDEPWQEAWKCCVEILTNNLPQYMPVKACLTTLTALRQNVIRQRNGAVLMESQRTSSSEHNANGEYATGQNTHLSESATSTLGSLSDYSQLPLESTFDPFAFVETDLFTDFGFDFSQPLM